MVLTHKRYESKKNIKNSLIIKTISIKNFDSIYQLLIFHKVKEGIYIHLFKGDKRKAALQKVNVIQLSILFQ